jgi:hypothetical protein
MDRKKLLIAGSLTGIIIVILSMGLVISPNSTPIKNLTSINSTASSLTENGLIFDNSTPEATAISIARLNEGAAGFGKGNGITTNATLTNDRQYWIVNMHEEGYNDWIVTIDAKTLMSKKNGGMEKPVNTWRSLDELKANFIAEIQSGSGIDFDRPYKTTLEGKTVWKIPLYNIMSSKRELYGYVYVDLTTGKSKNIDLLGRTEGWKTLKEIDDSINTMYDVGPTPFKDALRDLYPE